MAAGTGIEWADDTFNPWLGCQRVSPACDHCYAEAWAKRSGRVQWGPGANRVRTRPANWRAPLKWHREAAGWDRRRRVFCASLADVFDNAGDPDWRVDLWNLVRVTTNLQWLLLTKRPQNIPAMLPPDWSGPWGDGWPHVALGTTVEDQAEAARRVPALLDAPARWRFLSCEPLLGAVWPVVTDTNGHDIFPLRGLALDPTGEGADECYRTARIDWVIAGGESGPGARPMHPDHARRLRDDCRAAGVPFLFKQWGDWVPEAQEPSALSERSAAAALYLAPDGSTRPADRGARGDAVTVQRVGKKKAGRRLDGEELLAFPDFGRPGDGRTAQLEETLR